MKPKYKPIAKKGSAFDTLFISVFIFSFIIVCIVVYSVASKVSDDLQSQGSLSPTAQVDLDNTIDRFPSIFDNIMIAIIIGLSLVSVVGAFIIRSNPIFFFVAIIMLLTIGVINVVLKDTFFAFAQDNEMGQYANAFPKSTFIMTRWPFLMFAIGILIVILTYTRGQQTL